MKYLNVTQQTFSNLDSVISLKITPQLQSKIDTITPKTDARPNRIKAVHIAMENHGFITNSHQHIIANCFTEFKMKQLHRKII